MRRWNVGLIVVVVVGLAFAASGEVVKVDGRWVDTNAPATAAPDSAASAPVNAPPPNIWGTAHWQTYTVGACDAAVRYGTWLDDNCDSARSASSADLGLGYPIHLPSGASAQYVRIFYNETDLAKSVSAGFWRSSAYGVSTPISTASPTPISTGNAYQDFGPFSETINNDPTFGYTYEIDAIFGGSTRIYKFTIWYYLQISPAPASATFSDVPTSYWAFRHIEALYASGITSGCGTGPLIYCPERSITRAEMAVYLAKALGLYWDY